MKTITMLIMMLFMPIVLVHAQAEGMGNVVAFKEYLGQVLEYYPILKKDNASLEKAIAQKAVAASAQMPQLWASVKMDYGDDPVYVFGALLRQNKFSNDDFALGRLNSPAPKADYGAGVEGQWLLFDFSQTASKVKMFKATVEAADFQKKASRMEAILAASEVYSRLAQTDEFLKILDHIVKNVNDDVNMSESLSRQGLKLGADFYLARMVQTRLSQTKNEALAERAALNMVFNIMRGQAPDIPVTVMMDFNKSILLDGKAEDWVAKSVSHRLDIQAMSKMIESQGYGLEHERKSALPKIMAYGRADENVHRLGSSGGSNYTLGIKAKMDLFNPGHGSSVKVEQQEVNRLTAQLQQTKDQAAKDIAETFYRAEALVNNLKLAEQYRNDAQEAVSLMDPLYKEGRRSIEQMAAVRTSFLEADQRLLNLQAKRLQTYLTLKYYSGELNESEALNVYGQ